MAMLRAIAQDMEQLTSEIELIGGKVPSESIPHVYAFFDLADAYIEQEHSSPENNCNSPFPRVAQ